VWKCLELEGRSKYNAMHIFKSSLCYSSLQYIILFLNSLTIRTYFSTESPFKYITLRHLDLGPYIPSWYHATDLYLSQLLISPISSKSVHRSPSDFFVTIIRFISNEILKKISFRCNCNSSSLILLHRGSMWYQKLY